VYDVHITTTLMNTKLTTLPERYEPGFLREMDRRTDLAKRLQHAFDTIVDDVGGEETLSYAQLAFVERFIFLEALVQSWETRIVANPKGTTKLLSRWIQACNAMTGLARTFGLEKVEKRTIGLKAYIEAKG
jgi:hypothetical protein